MRGAARHAEIRIAKYRHMLRARKQPEKVLQRATLSNNVAALVESLRTGTQGHFFFDAAAAQIVTNRIEELVPGWRDRTIRDADRIRGGVVRILGADAVDVRRSAADASARGPGAHSLRWHEDVVGGYRWDRRTFYRQIAIPYDEADIKMPWELSRCQHLPTLGMAYAASGEAAYAADAVAQIADWISQNPAGYGVNWACTMDVAIRAVNWMWTYHLIATSEAVSESFLVNFLGSLLAHGRHIRRNIELYRDGITTNHTLADFVGLFYLGILLPGLREAHQWMAVGRAGIESCMRTQVHRDGVDFESSIAYHRLVLEMFFGSYVLAARNGIVFSNDYRGSLERMLEFTYHYTRPDGLAPLIGDSDDGRLQILSHYFDWIPQDHRYLLGAGAVLFDRGDFASAAEGAPGAAEETVWLLGLERARRPDPSGPPQRSSRAFPVSGRYVFRAGDHYGIVCADEVGTAGLGNHKHNDVFSFELEIEGVSVVVDPGSFVYTSDRISREYFRATATHNTLVVDGEEQNEFTGPFGMATNARVEVITWRTSSDVDVFEAEHTGYERLHNPVRHRRSVVFSKAPFAWIVVDMLAGSGEHNVESRIHFAPGGTPFDPEPLQPSIRRASRDAAELLHAETDAATGVEAAAHRALGYARDGVRVAIVPLGDVSGVWETGWFAPRYGQRLKAHVLTFATRLASGSPIGYVVLPL
jgi:hypothetical protein